MKSVRDYIMIIPKDRGCQGKTPQKQELPNIKKELCIYLPESYNLA